jgi:hypothetical protein
MAGNCLDHYASGGVDNADTVFATDNETLAVGKPHWLEHSSERVVMPFSFLGIGQVDHRHRSLVGDRQTAPIGGKGREVGLGRHIQNIESDGLKLEAGGRLDDVE